MNNDKIKNFLNDRTNDKQFLHEMFSHKIGKQKEGYISYYENIKNNVEKVRKIIILLIDECR